MVEGNFLLVFINFIIGCFYYLTYQLEVKEAVETLYYCMISPYWLTTHLRALGSISLSSDDPNNVITVVSVSRTTIVKIAEKIASIKEKESAHYLKWLYNFGSE